MNKTTNHDTVHSNSAEANGRHNDEVTVHPGRVATDSEVVTPDSERRNHPQTDIDQEDDALRNGPDNADQPTDADLQMQIERTNRLVSTVHHLAEESRRHHYSIGEALLELLDIPGTDGELPTLKSLQETHFSNLTLGFLSQCKRMAEATSDEDREELSKLGLSARETYDSIVQCERIARDATRRGVIDPPTLRDIASELAARKSELKVSARSIGKSWTRRQVERTRERKLAELDETKEQNPDWLSKMKPIDCRSLLRSDEVTNGSVQLAWFDPPYLYWQDGADVDDPLSGGGRSYNHNFGSALCAVADNHERKQVLPLVLETIRLVVPKLREDGFFVYWAAGGQLDEPDVVQELRRHFGYIFTYFWRKPPTVGYQFRQACVEVERVIVCAVNPQKIEDLDRTVLGSQIIEAYPTPTRTARTTAYGETSIYEKPIDLCRAFLSKLTMPGDLVLDLCGDRATMSEACVIDNRDWIYTETNEGNFAHGVGRIRKHFESVEDTVEADQDESTTWPQATDS